MPTYEYQCDACGHRFDQFQKITDEPLTKCPSCKRKKLRRLLGAGAAIVFKGTGFYQTDYRSESYRKAAASEEKKASASSETSTKRTDSGAESKGAAAKSASSDSHAVSPKKSRRKTND